MSALCLSNADVGLQLLRTGCASGVNGFLSPISISVALAMTYAGADGRTATQIHDVMFHKVKSENEINEGMCKIVKMLNDHKPGYELLVANRIYVRRGAPLLKPFENILLKYYDADVQMVQFDEKTRLSINEWVEEITKGHIKDLLNDLSPLTAAVIINAIYFKGLWKTAFDPLETKKNARFYSTPETETEVDMMRQKEREFLYGETEHIQILGMPYKGCDIVMYVFLSKHRYGLQQMDCQMTGKYILKLIEETKNTELVVTKSKIRCCINEQWLPVRLPKFTFETTIELAGPLEYMGVKDVFNPGADLTKMNGDPNLYVSRVIHKAFIEVNEEGTKAAAATALMSNYQTFVYEPPVPEFIADHSFLFALIDNGTRSLLFAGKFYNL